MIPAFKGVGILCIRILRRSLRDHDIRRRGSVIICHRAQYRTIFILEGHGVLIHCAAVGRCVSRVLGHIRNRAIPAGKLVGIPGIRCLCRIRRLLNVSGLCAVLIFRCAQYRAVCVLEGHGVLIHCASVGRLVGRIAGHFRNRGIPAAEGVGVLCIRGLRRIRRLRNVGRCGAVVILRRAQDRSVFVTEGHGVLIHCASVGRLVGRISGHIRDRGIPAAEGVGILSIRSLRRIRRLRNVGRCGAVVILRRAQDRSVFITEGHSVLIHCASVGRGIGRISGHFRNRGAPSAEGVGILCIRSLRRIRRLHDIRRRGAVVIFRRAQDRAVFVTEGHGVLIHCAAVGRSVSHIVGYSLNRGAPATEGVGIPGIRSLHRIRRLHDIRRRGAVSIRRLLQHGPVFVHEGYSILVLLCLPLSDR